MALLKGVYAIVNEGPKTAEITRAALDGGVYIVQYRAKRGINEQTLGALREMTQTAGALLIVNDDWRTARRSNCDGVHLGPEDVDAHRPSFVRDAWPEAVIGLSCATEEEIVAAESGSADYAGVGSVYETTSKSDAGAPIGPERLRAVVAAARIPVAAIGGIGVNNLGEVKRSGAAMAAVISAIEGAGNPTDAARSLVALWAKS